VSFLAAAVIGSSAVTNVVAVTKTMNTATATTLKRLCPRITSVSFQRRWTIDGRRECYEGNYEKTERVFLHTCRADLDTDDLAKVIP
jgi:hypothetical protein